MPDATHAIAANLAVRTGLQLSALQLGDLTRHLESRFGRGVDTAECLSRLDDPAEFRLLIDRLTVKETYFYRHETQFEALRSMLVPRFVQPARAAGRLVRMWSAGCCTGEEPFTLAIIAAECGCIDDVEILGTDINEGYLEAAMAAAYTARAVRQLPPDLLDRYFVRDRDRYVVRDELRRRVVFKYLNLADATYPSFLNGTSSVDVIFCRNVLIYFDREMARAIINRFAEAIVPHGAVAFGHSELLGPEAPLVVEQVADAFLYRRRDAVNPHAAPAESPTAPVQVRKLPGPTPTAMAQRQPVPQRDASGGVPSLASTASALVAQAAKFADSGRSAEALEACRLALTHDPALVAAHYLLGLLAHDAPAAAAEHFRRVIYLDPAHLTARLHLAQCTERLGTVELALREYRTLERLARSHPADEVIDPREGMTYGILVALSRAAEQRLV